MQFSNLKVDQLKKKYLGLMSINMILNVFLGDLQKQPSRGILKKSCSENMQQIYRRTTLKSHFGMGAVL